MARSSRSEARAIDGQRRSRGRRDDQLAQRHQPQPLGQALHDLPGQRHRRTGPLGDDRQVQRGRQQRRRGDLGGQPGRHARPPAAARPARRRPRPRRPAASDGRPARTAATGAANRSRTSAIDGAWLGRRARAGAGATGRSARPAGSPRCAARPGSPPRPRCPAAGRRPTAGRRRTRRGPRRARARPGPAGRRSPAVSRKRPVTPAMLTARLVSAVAMISRRSGWPVIAAGKRSRSGAGK